MVNIRRIVLCCICLMTLLLLFLEKSPVFEITKHEAHESTISTGPNCTRIFHGDSQEISSWSNYSHPSRSDVEMLHLFENCSNLLISHKEYASDNRKSQNEAFELAYVISMHKNVAQVERLLRMIYSPDNIYCIHVDANVHSHIIEAMRALASCLPNVFIASKLVAVKWGSFSVIKTVLNCMSDLLQYPKWKYALNLAGQDVPLKTNEEIVSILKVLNGSNDVQLTPELELSRYWFKYSNETLPLHQLWNLPVPMGWPIYKGNIAAVLSRDMVNFVLNDARSMKFTKWLKLTRMPDEHLWATLNHHANISAPGGYPDTCHNWSQPKPWISRYAKWRGQKCGGKLVRDVCILGVADLPQLVTKPHLFVNKFYADYQSAALDCMEEWLKSPERQPLNLSYYANLPSVKMHNWEVNHPHLKRGATCPKTSPHKLSLAPQFRKLISGRIKRIR